MLLGLFLEDAMYGKEYILRTGEVEEILNQLAYLNDWKCLVHNGRAMGPESDQSELAKIQSLLLSSKCRADLEGFRAQLSTGEISCVMCAETSKEVEKMRDYVLSEDRTKNEYHEKVSALFDKLSLLIDQNADDDSLFEAVTNRQYLTSGIACDSYLGDV